MSSSVSRDPSSFILHPSSFILRVMGIVNVTPDSFSDGGVHFDRANAIGSALQMEKDGAAMIDVGGESTRPGSEAVSIDQELERVVPVIEGIRARSGVTISIDTRKARVAEAALDAGADII
ncbi:MAG: dihydropteroate synthase, partial [Thermoanaerobaculia bacterium]